MDADSILHIVWPGGKVRVSVRRLNEKLQPHNAELYDIVLFPECRPAIVVQDVLQEDIDLLMHSIGFDFDLFFALHFDAQLKYRAAFLVALEVDDGSD